MTKQEKIQEAYDSIGLGYLVEQCDDEAWVEISGHIRFIPEDKLDRIEYNRKEHCVRPKSLSGIKNNNGWRKIESEEDLPVSGNYKVICTNYPKSVTAKYARSANTWVRIDTEYRHIINVTHYKAIIEDKLPIY